jgi:hypothetical protein
VRGATGKAASAQPQRACAHVLMLRSAPSIELLKVGHKVTAASRHLTEGSAACLLGLGTGIVLLAVHFTGGSGAALADSMLEFNAGGFFT